MNNFSSTSGAGNRKFIAAGEGASFGRGAGMRREDSGDAATYASYKSGRSRSGTNESAGAAGSRRGTLQRTQRAKIIPAVNK